MPETPVRSNLDISVTTRCRNAIWKLKQRADLTDFLCRDESHVWLALGDVKQSYCGDLSGDILMEYFPPLVSDGPDSATLSLPIGLYS